MVGASVCENLGERRWVHANNANVRDTSCSIVDNAEVLKSWQQNENIQY